MPRYSHIQPKKGKIVALHPAVKAVLVLIAVYILSFVLRGIVNKTAHLIVPVYSDSMRYAFSSRRALISRINELENTLESQNLAQQTVARIETENQELKAELGRLPESKGVLAHVLTIPNRSIYGTFLVDAGAIEGVNIGQVAYAFGTIALGTVTSVTEQSATIELYSTAGRETSGTAEGSQVAVTLVGRGAGEYEVRMPRNVPFDIGSVISEQSATSAILATVEKVITDPRDPFQRLLAKAPVNLQALKWVIIR